MVSTLNRLHKTVVKIDEAAIVMKQSPVEVAKILFVATKKQARISWHRRQAVDMPYVTEDGRVACLPLPDYSQGCQEMQNIDKMMKMAPSIHWQNVKDFRLHARRLNSKNLWSIKDPYTPSFGNLRGYVQKGLMQ